MKKSNNSFFTERFAQLFQEEDHDVKQRLNGKSFYSNRYIYHKFVEEDSRLTQEIFPLIRKELTEGKLESIILSIYKKEKLVEMEQLERRLQQMKEENILNIDQSPEWTRKEICSKELEYSVNSTLQQIVDCERSKYFHFTSRRYENQIFLNTHFYEYRCFELMYDDYVKRRKSIYNNDTDCIVKSYSENGMNLASIDQQFSKYGLLSLTSEMELIILDRPRIFDSRTNKTFFLKNVHKDFAEKLNDLIQREQIKSLSFRIDNDLIIENRYDQDTLLEEVQYGRKFSFQNLEKISISKLYSVDMQDTLWITIDQYNMTFEEILNDFEITHNESIVTQVIHLEYYIENEQYYIKHLDHEFIFYSEEEFAIRQYNHHQKGTATKRLKSFKIDNSCIPFRSNDDDEFLLYEILGEYFNSIELLNEYFDVILKK